jgi:ribosomal protein S18 acetylase RimI-like enzyme
MLALNIRKATLSDHDSIWSIIQKVIQTGDTYVYDPGSSREKMLNIWCSNDRHTYVSETDESVVGTFWMKTNQLDLGNHIVNAAYMVHPEWHGKGIGKQMALFSLKEAKRLGYHGMQFNLVVSTNSNAIKLWKKIGFEIIGEVPDAFRHSSGNLVSAYIMYKKL